MTSYEKFRSKARLQNIKFHEVMFSHKGAKFEATGYHVKILSELDQNVMGLESKRLITGSLVLFYYDDLRAIVCGRVEDSENLKYKRLLVSLHPHKNMDFNKKYTMIEYTVFFEPYYCALKVLQGMSDSTFPMERYIVDLNLSAKRPTYFIETSKGANESKFNRSQLSAYKNALNKEFVLIQGPPGTGKTFLGLEIVKYLIENTQTSPILVVSYKNHALDQFLEGLLQCTQDIIRFGGQSKNPKMTKLSMKNQRDRRKGHFNEYINSTISTCYRRYVNSENNLKISDRKLDMIVSGEAVVKFSTLVTYSVNCSWDIIYKNKSSIKWLLQDVAQIDEDDQLLHQVTSLLPSLSGSTWLFTMAAIRNLCNDIEKKGFLAIRTRSEIDDNKLKKLITVLLNKITTIKSYMASDLPPLQIEELSMDEQKDPFKIPIHKRWRLYKTWIKTYVTHIHAEIDRNIVQYNNAYKNFDRVSLPDNVQLMKEMDVIGMTTTCAARMRETLELLECPIVVIEEAAEVLEAHVVSAVTKHCKHLILIGDHQQLRPAVADYEIETKYELGVSLFERMVINGVECHTLDVQHRMRPEISKLIVPAIYPNLKDHKSVKKYPNVKGIHGNVFFLSHEEPEAHAGDCSKKNIHEAKFLVKLAEYLLQNDYKAVDITILAAYLGQVKALNTERRLSTHEGMKNIAIKSVDEYQGEENKIILLSLVRNNKESKIGFLANEKRVCVALSRAREGLYIMGNMKHLSSKSRLWKQIKESLQQSQEGVGPIMKLKCQIHGNISYVASEEDLESFKEGGCIEKCMEELECGHICRRKCHGLDVSHIAKYLCTETCKRYPCPIHDKIICDNLCCEKCGPCKVDTKEKLSCGHFAKCYMLTSDEENIDCQEIVMVILKCKRHKFKTHCYKLEDVNRVCTKCESEPQK